MWKGEVGEHGEVGVWKRMCRGGVCEGWMSGGEGCGGEWHVCGMCVGGKVGR